MASCVIVWIMAISGSEDYKAVTVQFTEKSLVTKSGELNDSLDAVPFPHCRPQSWSHLVVETVSER